MPMPANKFKTLNIVTQNARGLKSDQRINEVSTQIIKQGLFAVCLQETWKHGTDNFIDNNCLFILHGYTPTEDTSRRGKGGVGIALSQLAIQSWKDAGSDVYTNFGKRIVAIRLCLKDRNDKNIFIYLVSAYAPVGVADDNVWDTFLENLERCIYSKRESDILIIGSDTNSSLGTNNNPRNDNTMSSIGKFGLPHCNKAGIRLSSFLEINNLVACSTYFRKNTYTTWTHPRSKLPHQIDHILTLKTDFRRIIDVSVVQPLLDSDHIGLRCKLRLAVTFYKKTPNKHSLSILDSNQLLSSQRLSDEFNNLVSEKLDETDSVSYDFLAESMRSSAEATLGVKVRVCPDWFSANRNELSVLINNRNSAVFQKITRPTRGSINRAKNTRKELKNAIKRAKSDWIKKLCDSVSNPNSLRHGTKDYWDCIKLLKRGMSKPTPSKQVMMTKENGDKCSSAEENTRVFKNHFEKLYNRTPSYDPSVLDLLDQHPIMESTGLPPQDEEISKAISRLKNKAPGASGLTAQMFKSLLRHEQCLSYLKSIISDIWIKEIYPSQFDIGKLIVLPKKGDLSLPGNYRGIMLLEVAYKIIAIIIHNRLQPIVESIDHESQCGFRQGRGCADAVFTVKLAIKKRREHNQETWILFLDLVKAFDRVPRQLLWQILLKFGVSGKLVSILMLLHTNFKVEFEIDSVTDSITCTIGVKQGDILGPVLFVIFIAAVMITWRKAYDRPLCMFYTKDDFTLTGRKYNTKGDEFPVDDSEYADDTAVLFETRNDITTFSPLLVIHFNRFGTEIHVGDLDQPHKPSKTEVLFVSKPLKSYENPDTLDGTDLSIIELGDKKYFPVVDKFCYLGTYITRDCKDSEDINHRLKKAGNAFGSLKNSLFSSQSISDRAKGSAYQKLILPILLYGAESWCLTEILFNRIRKFHHYCLRTMCRINRKHVYKHRISNEQLLERLDIKPIDNYISRRQLSWLGHVARMPINRLPRKLLSSWVRCPRPRGCPEFTYGRSVFKALRYVNVCKSSWYDLANDRNAWKNVLNGL